MIPIVFNWGGDVRKVCEAGLVHCNVCHRIVGAEVWRTAKTGGVYWIKLIKWAKEYWYVCSACQAAAPLTSADVERIKHQALGIPSNSAAIETFTWITTSFEDWLDEASPSLPTVGQWLEDIKARLLRSGRPANHVDYVVGFWLQEHWEFVGPAIEAEAASMCDEKQGLSDEEVRGHLATLGLSPDEADLDSIRTAYRRLAREHHPDRHATKTADDQRAASKRMAEINAAYSALHTWASTPSVSETEDDLSDSAGAPNDTKQIVRSGHKQSSAVAKPPLGADAAGRKRSRAPMAIIAIGVAATVVWAICGAVLFPELGPAATSKTDPPAMKVTVPVEERRSMDAQGCFEKGFSLQNAGRHREAIQAYRAAVALVPDRWEPYFNMGLAYRDLGQNEDAVRAFKKAAELLPSTPGAHCNLGHAYSGLGRYQEALQAYKKALSLAARQGGAWQDEAEVRYGIGVAYERMGQTEQAGIEYDKAAKLAPHNAYGRAAQERLRQLGTAAKPPQLSGKVTVTRDSIVVIDIGSDAGVETGMSFVIFRNGKYVGTFTTNEVQPRISGGYVSFLAEGPVRKGDDAFLSDGAPR